MGLTCCSEAEEVFKMLNNGLEKASPAATAEEFAWLEAAMGQCELPKLGRPRPGEEETEDEEDEDEDVDDWGDFVLSDEHAETMQDRCMRLTAERFGKTAEKAPVKKVISPAKAK